MKFLLTTSTTRTLTVSCAQLQMAVNICLVIGYVHENYFKKKLVKGHYFIIKERKIKIITAGSQFHKPLNKCNLPWRLPCRKIHEKKKIGILSAIHLIMSEVNKRPLMILSYRCSN